MHVAESEYFWNIYTLAQLCKSLYTITFENLLTSASFTYIWILFSNIPLFNGPVSKLFRLNLKKMNLTFYLHLILTRPKLFASLGIRPTHIVMSFLTMCPGFDHDALRYSFLESISLLSERFFFYPLAKENCLAFAVNFNLVDCTQFPIVKWNETIGTSFCDFRFIIYCEVKAH